jgi:hypothetical protein
MNGCFAPKATPRISEAAPHQNDTERYGDFFEMTP